MPKNQLSGQLFKNGVDRWQFNTDDGREIELSCGSCVEVFAFGTWLPGRIEAGSNGYFFLDPDTGAKLRDLAGLRARLPQ